MILEQEEHLEVNLNVSSRPVLRNVVLLVGQVGLPSRELLVLETQPLHKPYARHLP